MEMSTSFRKREEKCKKKKEQYGFASGMVNKKVDKMQESIKYCIEVLQMMFWTVCMHHVKPISPVASIEVL